MPAGRPPKPPEERKDTRVVLSLNGADLERLDALVTTDEWGAENRQDMLRFLIREEYNRRVQTGQVKPRRRKRGSSK